MIHEVMSRIEEIDKYIYEVIVPKYKGFDAAHREDHALTVIEQAMKLLDGMQAWTGSCDAADEWTVPVDREVLKMAAACHDLGLVNGRDRHRRRGTCRRHRSVCHGRNRRRGGRTDGSRKKDGRRRTGG